MGKSLSRVVESKKVETKFAIRLIYISLMTTQSLLYCYKYLDQEKKKNKIHSWIGIIRHKKSVRWSSGLPFSFFEKILIVPCVDWAYI